MLAADSLANVTAPGGIYVPVDEVAHVWNLLCHIKDALKQKVHHEASIVERILLAPQHILNSNAPNFQYVLEASLIRNCLAPYTQNTSH